MVESIYSKHIIHILRDHFRGPSKVITYVIAQKQGFSILYSTNLNLIKFNTKKGLNKKILGKNGIWCYTTYFIFLFFL